MKQIITTRRGLLASAIAAPIAAAVPALPIAGASAPGMTISRAEIVSLMERIYDRWVEGEAADTSIYKDALDVLAAECGHFTVGDAVAYFDAAAQLYEVESDQMPEELRKGYDALGDALHRFIFEGTAATARDAIARLRCGLEDGNGHENWYNAAAFTENALRDLVRIQRDGMTWSDDSPLSRFGTWKCHAIPQPGEREPTAEEIAEHERLEAEQQAREQRVDEAMRAQQAKTLASMPADREGFIARYDALPPGARQRMHYWIEAFYGADGIERYLFA